MSTLAAIIPDAALRPILDGSPYTMEEQVREMFGLPDWRMAQWEVKRMDKPGEFCRLTGAVYPPKFIPSYEGEPDWTRPQRGTKKVVDLTRDQHSAWLYGWEARTGRCSRCMSKPGLVLVSWSSTEGTKHRTCPRCQGTGKAPEDVDQQKAARGAQCTR